MRIKTILILLLYSSIQHNVCAEEYTPYSYYIEAELLPDRIEILGTYSAIIEIEDTSMVGGFSIYAPGKGNTSKFYFSDSVNYYEDPLIERMFRSSIELTKLHVDGREFDVSALRRNGQFLKVDYQYRKTPGTQVHIETEFITIILDSGDGIMFAIDWLPLIKTENNDDHIDIPKMFEYRITFPKEYNFVPSGFVEDTLYTDSTVTYHVFDPYSPDALWLASPKIALLKEEHTPIHYKLYSACSSYPQGSMDQLEDQFIMLYDFFGPPVGERQELHCVLMPVNYSWLGGFNGGNIVAINSNYYNSSIFSNLFDDVILHELLHYWWINRLYGRLSEGDAVFHESFVRNMTYFLGQDTLAVQRKRDRGRLSRMFGFLSKIDTWSDLSPARGGYHFSILRSKDVDELDKIEKGYWALNALASMHSPKVWNNKIYEYFKAVKAKQAITYDLFCRLNPDIDRYLASWFEDPNDFDYAIKGVATKKIAESRYESIVEVENRGGIVSPCPVLIEYEDGSHALDTVVVFDKVDTIQTVSPLPVERVTLDYDHTIPDFDRSNNRNYRKIEFDISLSSFTNDGYKISTFPIALPAYSEVTGWHLESRILTFNSSRKSFGIAGSGSSHYMGIGVGYNFRSDRLMWNIRYSNPVRYPTKFSMLGFEASDTPECRSYEMNLAANKSKSFYSYPVHKFNVFIKHSKYYTPSYREREDWTTGNNISVGSSYTYQDYITSLYRVKGQYFNIAARKSFDIWDGEWNYEYLSGEAGSYLLLPHLVVSANRLFIGNIWGSAPIQERFDLGRDALFVSYPVYEETGYRLISFDTELRFRKRLPLFDAAVFYRNAWIKDHGLNDYRYTYELGVGLRALVLIIPMVFDVSLLRRTFDGDIDNYPVFQFKLGVPFSYSPMGYRWNYN